MFNRNCLLFDEVFTVDQPDLNTVPEYHLKGDNGEFLHYEDLPSGAKAEALIPILVASCLHLPSSPHKHAIQDVFGRLVFHAWSSLCGFHVTHKGSPSGLTVEATTYLHGRSLSSLMGVPEEAFIHFVILTDFLRYHFDSLKDLSFKYRHLLSGSNDFTNVSDLLETYAGKKALTKVEKGF